MVLSASNPGAVVDPAANLAVITGLDADHFVLDQHINGALTIADTAPAMGPQSSAAHRLAAASRILTGLPQPDHGSDGDSALSTD